MVNQSWGRYCGLLKVASCLTLGVFFPFDKHQALAEVTPDTTLGAERSRVTPDAQVRGGLADLIEGGAERGANLFHSFTDFNVEELQRVYFANPAGIDNIISRVTGTNPSSILGTLGVDGAANLFLLNPHGIIFGANAQLDIQGSFVASTANSITFGDGSSFSANPDNSSLLTVSVPLGLQYGTNQAGAIANAGNLAVGSGQTLSLSGGTVTSTGSLTAAGGRVEVLGNQVSLLDNARIDVSSDTGGGTVLIGGDFQGNGTVPNAVHTFVGSDVTINADALTNGDGGKVIVWADQTATVHGTLTARGGTVSGDGGFIETSGKQFLNLTSTPDASAPNGSGGTWLIDPTDITLANGGGAIGTNTVDVDNINAALNRGTNVTISTSIGGTDQGNITQNNDAPIRKTAGGDATLTLQAENDIDLKADITSNSGQLNVELLADSDNSGAGAIGIFNATIDTNGGDFIGSGKGSQARREGIFIGFSSINAEDGSINLVGRGRDGSNNTNNHGITLLQSRLETSGLGNITLIGNGGTEGDFSIGIDVIENTTVSSENGDIRLIGTGGGVNNGWGLQVRDGSVVRSTGTGNISLKGTSNGTGAGNYGIIIREQHFSGSPGVVEATGTGSITLEGTGSNGTDVNPGILIEASGRVSTATGNISLTGTGNGTGNDNTGIFIKSGGVVETTNGTIDLEGFSGSGANFNHGILLQDANSRISSINGDITLTGANNAAQTSAGTTNHGIFIRVDGLVQSSGNITLTGTTNGTGLNREGISIVRGGRVESTGTGMITMTGNGGNGGIGSDGNQGIVVLDPNTRVTSVDGDILLRGISRGTGTNNYGIWLGRAGDGVVRTTGTGNITLEGIISGIGNNSEGIFFGDGGAIEAIGTGNITLTADEITIASNLAEITGTNRLQLQPLDPTLGITIGGTTTDARLNLDSSELNTLQKGFAQILIGRDNSSGAIAILPAAFNSPTTIQTPVTGGTITTTGAINTNNNPLTFIAGSDVIFNNDINTGSGNLSVLGSTITQTSGSLFVNGDAFFTSTLANAGNVSVTNTKPTTVGYSIIGGNFTLNSALPITQVPGEPLQVAGDISVNGGDSQPLINTIGDFSQETLLPNGDLIITQLGTVNLEANTVTGNLTVNSLPAAVVSFNQVLDNPAITLNQDNSFGGTLRFNTTTDAILLEGTPGIIQTGTQTVSGTATFNANTGNISLNEPANQFGNLAFTGNDVSIRESDGTNLITSSATGNLNLTSGGMITQNIGASLTVVGDTSLTTTLPNAGNVTITNSNATIIGNSLIGGDFTINSTGPIFQAPGEILQVAGNTIPNAPSDNLEPTGNNTILPRITLPNGDVIITDVGLITLSAESISGNLTVNSLGRRLTFNNNEAFNESTAIELAQSGNSFGGVLRINTEAPLSRLDTGTPEIIQNGSLNVSGTASFKAKNGNITLNNSENQFGNLSFTGGNISINESDSSNLLNSTYAGNVTITSGGAIAQIGSLSIIGSSNQEKSLILNAIGDINTQDIISPSGSITLTSNNGSIDTTEGILSTFSSGSGGAITLSADGDLNLGSLDSSGSTVAGGDITLNSNSAIIAKNQLITTETRGSVKAGDINIIKAQSVSFTGTRVSTITRGDGLGGNLNINASDSINIINGSRLLVQTYGTGDAGNAIINTQQLVVQNDRPELNRYTGIGTETFSSGNGGNLTINASESVKLRGNQSIVFNPNPLDLDSLRQAGQTATGLTTATFGTGNAGNLSLTTSSLVIQNGAGIISGPVLSDENDAQGTLPEGKGGELSITATESIEIQGQAGIATATLGNGDAGNLFLNSGRITLEEGATISAGTITGPVATPINASGNAGDIDITTNQLSVRSGSRIGAATTNRGEGGNITINASESVEVIGTSADGTVPSGVFTAALLGSTAEAGDLEITTGKLTLEDGAEITAQSEGEGDAGNINLNVSDRLTATDGNIITATTQSAGGEIKITAKDIRLRGDSDITTSVFSGAENGGNITITTDSLIAFADSDILAFARDGRGGDITFKTPIFFGFAFRPAPKGTDPATLDNNNRVDINASGAVDGVITLPNLDFIENSLTELPDNLIDTDNLLANSCIVRTSEQEGKFIITGGGNLPTRPGDASVSRYPTGEVRTVVPSESASRPWQKGDPIVEATGVYQLPNGNLVMGRECS